MPRSLPNFKVKKRQTATSKKEQKKERKLHASGRENDERKSTIKSGW